MFPFEYSGLFLWLRGVSMPSPPAIINTSCVLHKHPRCSSYGVVSRWKMDFLVPSVLGVNMPRGSSWGWLRRGERIRHAFLSLVSDRERWGHGTQRHDWSPQEASHEDGREPEIDTVRLRTERIVQHWLHRLSCTTGHQSHAGCLLAGNQSILSVSIKNNQCCKEWRKGLGDIKSNYLGEGGVLKLSGALLWNQSGSASLFFMSSSEFLFYLQFFFFLTWDLSPFVMIGVPMCKYCMPPLCFERCAVERKTEPQCISISPSLSSISLKGVCSGLVIGSGAKCKISWAGCRRCGASQTRCSTDGPS